MTDGAKKKKKKKCIKRYHEGYIVVQNNLRWKCSINGGGSYTYAPWRYIPNQGCLRPTVTCREHHTHSHLHRMEGSDVGGRHEEREQRRSQPEGGRDHMNPVVQRFVKRRHHVGLRAYPVEIFVPAGFVNRQPGPRGASPGGALGESEEVGVVNDDGADGRGGDVSAVAEVVPR